jgi:hypothetical protein
MADLTVMEHICLTGGIPVIMVSAGGSPTRNHS